ncbi:hypothetical protein [Pedobacter sp. JY14-1]|uniref:hypothetical protein n=1 Tax=Pedobacter sp. JY14-1 TaxID=3034151 RepID=UPI0023E1DBE7|nr:hypothetical protein [Pedobacter sp. JY14-1]
MIRRAYSSILLFYLALHFIFPLIYYFNFGFVNLYSEQEFNGSVLRGVALNFIAIIGTIIVIQFIPEPKGKIAPRYNYSLSFLSISILILIAGRILSGGFEGALSGSLHGSIVSYLALFFDSSTALLLFLFYKKNVRLGVVVLILYVGFMTYLGSRSAIITVILAALMLPVFANEQKMRNQLWGLIAVLTVVSPVLFYIGTSMRGDVDKELLGKIIIGRISMVELSAIPIEGKTTGYMDFKLYNAKYGLVNQIKQCINEVSPIDPFEHDINPNQYYRAIFKGANEETAVDQYFSINLTFPTYLYLETNFVVACLLSILALSAIYYFAVRYRHNVIILLLVLMQTYHLLYYFDWVMITQGVFRTVLTVFTIKYFDIFMASLADAFRLIVRNKATNETL